MFRDRVAVLRPPLGLMAFLPLGRCVGIPPTSQTRPTHRHPRQVAQVVASLPSRETTFRPVARTAGPPNSYRR